MDFSNASGRLKSPLDTKPQHYANDDDSISGGVSLNSPGRGWWRAAPPLSRTSNNQDALASESRVFDGTGSFGETSGAQNRGAGYEFWNFNAAPRITARDSPPKKSLDAHSTSQDYRRRPSRKRGRGGRGRKLEENPYTEISTFSPPRNGHYSPGTGAMQQAEAIALLHAETARTTNQALSQTTGSPRTERERGARLETKRKRRPGTNLRPAGKAAAKAAKEAAQTGSKPAPKAMYTSSFAAKATAKPASNPATKVGGTPSKIGTKDRGYSHKDLIAAELTMAFSGESTENLDSKTRKRVEDLRNDYIPADPMAPLPDFDETVKEILFRARKKEEAGNKIKIANELRMDTQYAESNVDVKTLDISEGRKNRILALREQAAKEAGTEATAHEAREKEGTAREDAKMKERLVRFG